jgi:hypothetical protein
MDKRCLVLREFFPRFISTLKKFFQYSKILDLVKDQ